MRRVLAIAMAGATLAAVGCGGGGDQAAEPAASIPAPTTQARSGSSTTLNQATTVGVARLNLAVAKYCYAIISSGSATPAQERKAIIAVDDMIALARLDPDAVYAPGSGDPVTMRQFLGDIASQFENGGCSPSLASKLDRARESL
ncbi:MAG: hypothetical protein H0W81_11925 [Chloroflexi bacterium]|nr:hypothetical protein [Chloroflexota bacterium]